MDIDPQRLAESARSSPSKLAATLGVAGHRRDLHRPARGARRRRLRRRRLPDRRLRARARSPISRCPKKLRPAPDHRRHARHRRHHARPPHRAASLDDLRGHAGGLPRRDHAAIRQPDGDQHLGDRREIPDDPARSASAIRCRAPPRSWRATSTSRSRRSATAAAGINHMAFYLKFEQRHAGRLATATSIPTSSAAIARAASRSPALEPALPEQGALRDADPARLFRHRELGAFRRIRALVHQARPRRT